MKKIKYELIQIGAFSYGRFSSIKSAQKHVKGLQGLFQIIDIKNNVTIKEFANK